MMRLPSLLASFLIFLDIPLALLWFTFVTALYKRCKAITMYKAGLDDWRLQTGLGLHHRSTDAFGPPGPFAL